MKRRAFVATALSASRILGANDRVRIGLIGAGGRGFYVATLMKRAPKVDYVAVADVWEPNQRKTREWAGADCRMFTDFRKILELKDVDAVHVGASDHWHCIPTVMACAAGKDVYVEKPLGHNIREQQAMVKAARQHNRIVQTGTQHRSAPHFPEVAEIIRSGELGEIRFVRVWNYANFTGAAVASVPDSAPPAGLDWDFYLGPAPKVPYNARRHLVTYRYFFDYAGGYITDFGIHRLDTVHQVMGLDGAGAGPKSVSAVGGRFTWKGPGDVPDTLQATFEYPGFVLSYEGVNTNGFGVGALTPGHKYYNQGFEHDQPNGICIYGTNGTIFCERIGYEVFPEPVSRMEKKPRIKERRRNVTDATEAHAANFVDCVRSRKRPNADVEIGHRSSLIAHLGNIAYKTGRKIKWDSEREQIVGDAEASALLGRKARKPWDLI